MVLFSVNDYVCEKLKQKKTKTNKQKQLIAQPLRLIHLTNQHTDNKYGNMDNYTLHSLLSKHIFMTAYTGITINGSINNSCQ